MRIFLSLRSYNNNIPLSEKEIPRFWRDEYLVHWHEAGLDGKVRMSSLCNYLQETAGRHAEKMGFGFDDVRKRNEVWVIIGLMVRVLRYPSWGEVITVETWPKGLDRLLAFRDFRITDGSGEVIGAATSSWMIIDKTSRRPKPVDVVKHALHLATPQDVLQENPPHLQPLSYPENIHLHKVAYSELDHNGHVNNTRYIDWCLDSYSSDWHRENRIRTMTVNFLSETRIGDHIILEAERSSDHTHHLQGLKENDGKPVFRARIEWISG